MKTAKKVLGVLVALAMLVNVFAMMSFAMTPDTAYELYLSTDKDSYKAGDVVTFTLSVETDASITEVRIDGTFALGYNNSVFGAPTDGDVLELPTYNFTDLIPGYDSGMSGCGVIERDNIDAKNDWNDAILLGVGSDSSKVSSEGKVDLFTFQMKLADTVADGDYVVGFCQTSFENAESYYNDAFTFDPETAGVTTANVFAFNDATIHVGEEKVESIIKQGGVQIRFRGVGEDADFSGYQNVFDVRAVAKISDADFKAAFGATDGEALKKIADIGFVFAPISAGWDMNTAIALAQGDGDVDGNYSKKHCKYIQHTGDGADYIFTCIVTDIEDDENGVNRSNGFTSIAYAKDIDGNFYVFDEPAPAPYQVLFNQYFKG